MEALKELIEETLEYAEKHGWDMDSTDRRDTGNIIISLNEAKEILKLIKESEGNNGFPAPQNKNNDA